jgi:hypothetical protein
MNKFKLFYLLLAAPLLLNVSCSKDEPEPEPEVTYKKPVASTRTTLIETPAGLQNSTDPNAAMATAWMGIANGLAAYGSSFTIPENAQTGGDKSDGTVYFWTYGGYSYWMTFTEFADKYVWKYEYAFPNTTRFTFIEAEELKTGKEGSWAIYSPEGTHPVLWDYDWTINASNDFSAEMMWYGDDDSESIKFLVLDKADNSGYFKMFEGAVQIVQVSWNANGSGSWWVKDGSTTISGSWN